MDSKDGVGTGRVLIHESVTHCSVSPACLHDLLTLDHAMHGVQREPLHIHPFLWVLLQLQTGTMQDRLEQDAARLWEGTLEIARKLEGYTSFTRGEIKTAVWQKHIWLPLKSLIVSEGGIKPHEKREPLSWLCRQKELKLKVC